MTSRSLSAQEVGVAVDATELFNIASIAIDDENRDNCEHDANNQNSSSSQSNHHSKSNEPVFVMRDAGGAQQKTTHEISMQERLRPHHDDDDDDDDDDDANDLTVIAAKSSIPGAVFNFTNSIVGAGIIGLPYSLSRSGFWYGIFLLLFVSFLIDYGVRNLIACGVAKKKLDYELIVEYAYGKLGYYSVTIFMFLFAYGAMIAYHVVIGDTIPPIVQFIDPNIQAPFGDRWFIVCCYSVLFMLPLSMLKSMSALSWTSSISIVAVFVIVTLVMIQAPQTSHKIDHSQPLSVIEDHWFAGVGTMSFAFVCHHSSFIVYNSLKNANQKRWKTVSHSSVAMSLFLSLCLSIVSYICFRDSVQSDVLNSFAYHNIVINVARLLLAMTMVFTFPMEQFVARHCVMKLLEIVLVHKLKLCHSGHHSQHSRPHQQNNSRSSNYFNDPARYPKQHSAILYLTTFLLWVSSLAIGASVTDLGIVLELSGSLCASSLGYIIPGLVILKVNNLWHNRKREWKNPQFIIALFMVVFGVVVMISGTISSFL